ncbi:histidine phosphatase family protein [Algoriphagus confluentis]|uniref:Phosphohistidine phosphatase SixA n=1 Tax=Algoriphagus confluentis TaxID=1697556 RepID=A0ABQ6PNE9_9BACT|nr:phosphohistidine phosphatase SixA [Algoriphagus confluentis]
MKKFILIRHAKSAWDQPFLQDHDRPLAERGLKDAPKMALKLKKKGIFPDLMISSSALRASETAKITAKELGYPKKEIKEDSRLYHASPHAILKILRSQSDSVNSLFLFGHNPGMNDLITYLGGDLDNLPTSGQFGFYLDADSWEKLSPQNVRVWFMDFPKNKT